MTRSKGILTCQLKLCSQELLARNYSYMGETEAQAVKKLLKVINS